MIGIEKSYDATDDKKERTVSFRDKTVVNILKGIEDSKQTTFNRVLYALGIRFVGETVAKKLAVHFISIDHLAAASYEALVEVEEIGDKIAQSILSWFSVPKNIELLDRLRASGIKFILDESTESRLSSVLEGKTFVVSGVFENFSRDDLKKTIEAHGGKNTGSISAKTSYVVAGENMGPEKRKKAEKLGVTIISERDFISLIS